MDLKCSKISVSATYSRTKEHFCQISIVANLDISLKEGHLYWSKSLSQKCVVLIMFSFQMTNRTFHVSSLTIKFHVNEQKIPIYSGIFVTTATCIFSRFFNKKVTNVRLSGDLTRHFGY
jgi:hypothetical protein